MRFLFTIFLLLSSLSGVIAAPVPPDVSPAEIQRLGERMYRDGILPSGEVMKAFVSDDVPVDGTAFTCVSCHLHSGLGSIEGEVITPPTNGRILYEERKPFIKGAEFVPSIANYAKYLPERPAYTDATLSTLISAGVDPTGRSVLKAMPRYELDDRDMSIMIAYLKTLSDKLPPGVSDREIKFATVIVEGSDPKAIESMVLPLQFTVDRKNSLAKASEANDRVARMGYNMLGDLHAYTFTLSRWLLKGAPETWRAQLETYYEKEPIYALLGGISPGTWEPVHRFCEDYRIPSLFPVVDEPVLSNTDWYTLYFSRGTRQEGEAAARYLHGMIDLVKDRSIVQVTRDGKNNRAMADGFRTIWAETGHSPAIEISLSEEEPFSAEALQKLVSEHNPAVLIVWDDSSFLKLLPGLMGLPEHPGMVLGSATILGEAIYSVPEEQRSLLFLTWPYRLPQDEKRYDIATRKVLAGKHAQNYDLNIIRKSYITQEILGKALMMMRLEFYRDFLLDTIGMMEDMFFPLYERVSFGPGQRYASKGCYILQVGKGESPQLEKRSEWVIQ